MNFTVEVSEDDIIEALVKSWLSRDGKHGEARNCPFCHKDTSGVGIDTLAYTWEICDCGTPEYRHMVERMWHRGCLVMVTPAYGLPGKER